MEFVPLDKVQYEPVGECIYCGYKENPKRLQGEHIIPYAFAGRAVLPRSSCPDCSKITSQFERACAKDAFGSIRLFQRFPSRRAENRPKTWMVRRIKDGVSDEIELPLEQAPLPPFIMPVLPPPEQILTHPLPEADRVVKVVMFGPDQTDPRNLARNVNVKTDGQPVDIAFDIKFPIGAFYRMLAKIAHATAVAEYGLGTFQPLLLPLIVHGQSPLHHFVGGAGRPLPIVESDYSYEMGKFVRADGEVFIAMSFKLFSMLDTPTYFIVIGRPSAQLLSFLNQPPSPSDHLLRSGPRAFERWRVEQSKRSALTEG